MSRIKRTKPSPALIIAVVALVAALAGTAVGGVTVSALKKGEKQQVKKISKRVSKKQAKKLDRKIELLPGPQGAQGEQGPQGEPAGTFWVFSNNGGGIVREKGVANIDTSGGTGLYEVEFEQDVSNCAWLATISRTAQAEPVSGEIGVRPTADPTKVMVHTWNDAGTPIINRFMLMATC
jgi:hypothetical protein